MIGKLASALCVLSAIVLYYAGFDPWQLIGGSDGPQNEDRLFTAEELSAYDGETSDRLCLSLLGKIYDVTDGRRHYEKGSDYHVFIGRDASRSFITGEFGESSKDLDDVMTMEPTELMGLEHWLGLFNKKYKYMGKLIGRFYDNRGRETEYLKKTKAKIEEGKIIEFKKSEADKMYPPCNSEWSAETGSRVWCTDKSGGISRNWVGVPRKMHAPGLDAPVCVCINLQNNEHLNNPQMKGYEGCDPKSVVCDIPL